MCNTECRKNATNPTFDVPKFGCLERPGHCDRQLFYGHQARPGSLSESRAKIPSAISLFHSWIPAESVTRSNSQQITTWFELFELFAPCSQHESSLVGERFIAQHMAGWLEPCDQMAGMIILAQLDSSTRRLVIFNFTRESSPDYRLTFGLDDCPQSLLDAVEEFENSLQASASLNTSVRYRWQKWQKGVSSLQVSDPHLGCLFLMLHEMCRAAMN